MSLTVGTLEHEKCHSRRTVRPSVILKCPSGNPDRFCGPRSCILRRSGVRNKIELLVGNGSDLQAAKIKVLLFASRINLKFFGEGTTRVIMALRPGIRQCGEAKLVYM